jgi:hypothetical protein
VAYFNWEDNTWVKYTVNGFYFFPHTIFFLFSPKNFGNLFWKFIYFLYISVNLTFFFYFSGKFFQILNNCQKEKKKKKKKKLLMVGGWF